VCWWYTAWYMSKATIGGDLRQMVMFGVAIPALVIAAHLTEVGRKVSNLSNCQDL